MMNEPVKFLLELDKFSAMLRAYDDMKVMNNIAAEALQVSGFQELQGQLAIKQKAFYDALMELKA
jgi:hypothetical protein